MTRTPLAIAAVVAAFAVGCAPKATPPETAPEIEIEDAAVTKDEGPRDVVEETEDPDEEKAPAEAVELAPPETPETPEVDNPTDTEVPLPKPDREE